MTTISESSYAMSVAKFESLLIAIRSFGASYKPVKESIQVSAMEALLAQAKEAIVEYTAAKSIYSTSVDAQKEAFMSIGQLITRVRNALRASDSTVGTDETAQSIFRKLYGQRASAKFTKEEKTTMEAEGKAVNQISVSQMSYSNRISNLQDLVSLLSIIPAYKPNEEDLKVAALSNLATQLQAKNTDVASAFIQLNIARNKRKSIIRDSEKSLSKTASDAKLYTKSAFGATSPEYKRISKISIR